MKLYSLTMARMARKKHNLRRIIMLLGISFVACLVHEKLLAQQTITQTSVDFTTSSSSEFGAENGYLVEPGIASELHKGFQIDIKLTNTNLLNPAAGYSNKIFAVGLKNGSSFSTIIRLMVKDEQLLVYRSLSGTGAVVPAIPSWNLHMLKYNAGTEMVVRFRIDSFSTKIYVFRSSAYDPAVQTCELLFWGMLGTYAKTAFTNYTGTPAVLLPSDYPYFMSAVISTPEHIYASPVTSHAVTGGSESNPLSRTSQSALQECNCDAEVLKPGAIRNLLTNATSLPKIPKYLALQNNALSPEKHDVATAFYWNVFPNPADDKINIEIRTAYGVKSRMELLDGAGRTVYSELLALSPGTNRHQLSLKSRGLSSGTYFIRIQSLPGTDGAAPATGNGFDLVRTIILN